MSQFGQTGGGHRTVFGGELKRVAQPAESRNLTSFSFDRYFLAASAVNHSGHKREVPSTANSSRRRIQHGFDEGHGEFALRRQAGVIQQFQQLEERIHLAAATAQ